MGKISEMLNRLRSATTKEHEKVLGEIISHIMDDKFGEVMEGEKFGDIVELLIEIPEDIFEKFVAKHKEILKRKINEAYPSDIGRLYEGLTKPKRKVLSLNFRESIVQRLSSLNLQDVVRMLYNVVPAAREMVLNQYKQIMMKPDFAEKILDAPVEIVSEFLSLAPETIRNTIIKRHGDVFTSDEFVAKLRNTDPEERTKLYRWLPPEMAKMINAKLKS